jgi:hypothetical protein
MTAFPANATVFVGGAPGRGEFSRRRRNRRHRQRGINPFPATTLARPGFPALCFPDPQRTNS